MISQVTFTIEHGETTDPLHDFIVHVTDTVNAKREVPDTEITDYTVSVDIDEDSL